MTVPYDRPVPGEYDVTVEADGEITIAIDGGYHGEQVDRVFTGEQMKTIAAYAERHRAAYQAWVDGDYEDEQVYFDAMGEECQK